MTALVAAPTSRKKVRRQRTASGVRVNPYHQRQKHCEIRNPRATKASINAKIRDRLCGRAREMVCSGPSPSIQSP